MAQLITKYADAVDQNGLPDPDYEKLNIDENVAETSVSAIFLQKSYTDNILRVTIKLKFGQNNSLNEGKENIWKIQ